MNKFQRWVISTLFLLGLTTQGIECLWAFKIDTAVCTATKLVIRQKPDQRSHVDGYLIKEETAFIVKEETQTVHIDNLDSNWQKVVGSSGTVGWAFGGYLKKSNPILPSKANRGVLDKFLLAYYWTNSDLPNEWISLQQIHKTDYHKYGEEIVNLEFIDLNHDGEEDIFFTVRHPHYEEDYKAKGLNVFSVFGLINSKPLKFQYAFSVENEALDTHGRWEILELSKGNGNSVCYYGPAHYGYEIFPEVIEIYRVDVSGNASNLVQVIPMEIDPGNGVMVNADDAKWNPLPNGNQRLTVTFYSKKDIYDWDGELMVLSTSTPLNINENVESH